MSEIHTRCADCSRGSGSFCQRRVTAVWIEDIGFDLIRAFDESSISCAMFVGRDDRQIQDRRVEEEPEGETFLVVARYTGGTSIEFAINQQFGTQVKAEVAALRVPKPMGQLSTLLMGGARRFSGFQAGAGHIIVCCGTADKRASENHLEESLLYEAVHASLAQDRRLADGWKRANDSDGLFATSHAPRRREQEDLAEAALLAFTLSHYPGRFPPGNSEATMRRSTKDCVHREALSAGRAARV